MVVTDSGFEKCWITLVDSFFLQIIHHNMGSMLQNIKLQTLCDIVHPSPTTISRKHSKSDFSDSHHPYNPRLPLPLRAGASQRYHRPRFHILSKIHVRSTMFLWHHATMTTPVHPWYSAQVSYHTELQKQERRKTEISYI